MVNSEQNLTGIYQRDSYKSDGVSPYNDGVGMVLRTTYSVNESGMFKIDAMIVPDVDEDEDNDDI